MMWWIFNPAAWAITVMLVWFAAMGSWVFTAKRGIASAAKTLRRSKEDSEQMRDNTDEEAP